MLVGRDDDSSHQIVPMAKALKANHASVSYAIYPGGHDWSVWYPRLNQMLILASNDVSQPLRAQPAAAEKAAAKAASVGRHVARRHTARARQRSVVGRRRFAFAGYHHRQPIVGRRGLLVGGLLLALGSAAAINLGFLLQHRGLAARPTGVRGSLAIALRSRSWLAGQALGWIGFTAQILAVAIAPLSLVQAFAAGGLAISVPLAAGLFGYRISTVQLLAVLLIAASLASLPVALSTAHGHLDETTLIWLSAAALLAATVIALAGVASLRAIAAGVFYGVADAAIKAVTIGWRAHGSGALLSGWTVLAVVATFGGFVSFQAALRADSPVSAISLMSALAALIAVGCGVFAFGESLGATPTATIVHLLAISIVLACVPALASAQQRMATAGPLASEPVSLTGSLQAGYRTT